MVKKIKKKKNKAWLILFLIFLFLFSLSFFVFKIYHSLAKSLWDGQNQFNVVINSQPVNLVSFNPLEEKINLLLIPNGTFIETIHGYGPYRIESVYKLGELKGNGSELLTGSLQDSFGLTVDGLLKGADNEWQKNGLKNNLLNQFFNSFAHDKKTNLSRWDLLRLWWRIKMIREDKITLIDLSETSVSQEVDLPDGTKAMKVDTERLDRIISQFFADEKIKKEDLTIAVLNKTEKIGLANKAAKLISNIGGRVVNIGVQIPDTDKKDGCELKSEKKYKNSYTVKKLSKIFNCQWVGESDDKQRSMVVILLGNDYWSRLNLP